MKSKRKIGVEQIFDNYLLFILFEPVNLMNIRYIFTTLLSPRGVVSDDGALLLSQVARPPGVESLQEQVNVPSPIHLQTLIHVTGIN